MNLYFVGNAKGNTHMFHDVYRYRNEDAAQRQHCKNADTVYVAHPVRDSAISKQWNTVNSKFRFQTFAIKQ